MKDAPVVAVAAGLAGLVGLFVPLAGGEVLNYSLEFGGRSYSLESLGLFSVSRLIFLPSLLTVLVGGYSMWRGRFQRSQAAAVTICACLTLAAWLLQRSMIARLSIVGVSASFGLTLLGTSGVIALAAGLAGCFRPTSNP